MRIYRLFNKNYTSCTKTNYKEVKKKELQEKNNSSAGSNQTQHLI